MRADVLHEIGHALGLRGHSNNRKDMMFSEEEVVYTEEKGGEFSMDRTRRGPSGMASASWVSKKPTKRDVNTLIRLYNCPGLISPLDYYSSQNKA